MNIFRRPATHCGKTPEPETSYQKASQVWDERIGSPHKRFALCSPLASGATRVHHAGNVPERVIAELWSQGWPYIPHGGDGVGLGPHVCQQIVSAAGGRLEIISPAPGRTDGFIAGVTSLPSPVREG